MDRPLACVRALLAGVRAPAAGRPVLAGPRSSAGRHVLAGPRALARRPALAGFRSLLADGVVT